MSTSTARLPAGLSPRGLARIAGVLYLVIFIVAPSGASTATPLKMLVTMTCDTGVALAFYALFRPVSRSLSLTALIFRLVFVALMTLASLDYFGALDLAGSAHSAQAFDTVYSLALAPFGAHCLLVGYLIYGARFLPRFLGMLLALAGVAYVSFVSLWFVHHASIFILIPGALGESVLTLWLLSVGVNGEQWERQSDRFACG